MAKPPESTKTSLRQRLAARARGAVAPARRHRRPLARPVRLRQPASSPDGTSLPLFRLRYAGSASTWGFAIYRASHDDYENSLLPSGWPAGTAQEALDCACGLYLGDHTAWLTQPPPTN